MQGAEGLDGKTSRYAWAEASIWTERMVSALETGVKGGKWYSLMDKVYAPRTLDAAWAKVQANKGAAGVDGVSVERFAGGAAAYLAELSQALKEGRYHPQPVRRVDIPKGDGRTRPLGIPAVKDRIVQTAVKMALEPVFEAVFAEGSYGFRPGRSCKDALREVDGLLKAGHVFVVDADIKGYFDAIPHERLVKRVEERVSDGALLGLIGSWLKQDVVKGMERWTPTGGTLAKGRSSARCSPTSISTRSMWHWQRRASGWCAMPTTSWFSAKAGRRLKAALAEVQRWMAGNGLELHPGKTHLGDCRVAGEGFAFLGYRFEAGRRTVRKKSLDKLKDSIRAATRRTAGMSLEQVIAVLNPKLRGWFGYFKHAHPPIFERLDGMIRRRLRALLRKQEKRPGLGLCHADHRRWPNIYFAKAGLFALHTAWQNARYPR